MLKTDYLPKTDIKIIQDDNHFCINTDTQVLGEFIEVYKNDVVYDFGTNNGALMLYISRFNPKKIIGIDINKDALELAKTNLDNNGISNYELINCDIKELHDLNADVIVCNPPYFKTVEKDFPKNDYKKLAKHEYMINLDSLVNSISRNLKDNGKLFFLFLSSRLEEVMKTFNKYNLKIKLLKFIYDDNKPFSNVFVCKAVKNGFVGMNVLKPEIIEH